MMHERKMYGEHSRRSRIVALRLIKVEALLDRAIYQRRRVDISKIYSSYATRASWLARVIARSLFTIRRAPRIAIRDGYTR